MSSTGASRLAATRSASCPGSLIESISEPASRGSSGNYSLILQGLTRIRLDSVTQSNPYMRAKVTRVESPASEDVEAEA
ncbi:MAG TPA: LON peptidase substrate-binding domain-containing protein, partial [Polyangiales bacterium]|nr:LON peptidase substrate-binding domain-containing protein [Polyangiales bacterium]